jgi:hypothetical protein
MVTSKTKKCKYAIETISEKIEKSGEIGEKFNFFERGVCKSTLYINGKVENMHFDFLQFIHGLVILFFKTMV